MSRLDIEEVTKTTLAVILVLGTFALAFYPYPACPPEPNPDMPIRLLIVPTRSLHLNKQENMARARFVVDRHDTINRSRNDPVGLSLNEKSNASIGVRTPSEVIWEKHLTIRFQNGTAEFMLLGRSPESAMISAHCIERDPPTIALISSLAIGLEEG